MQAIPIWEHLVCEMVYVVEQQPESTPGWTMAILQPLPPGSFRYTNGQSSREPDPILIFLPTMLVMVVDTISMESMAMSIRQARTTWALLKWLSGTANRAAFGMGGMNPEIQQVLNFLQTEPIFIKVLSASYLLPTAPPLQTDAPSRPR